MRALAYLELHYGLHRFRAIVRSPLRLIIWTMYALVLAGFTYLRIARYHGSSSVLALSTDLATQVGAGAVALLGVVVATAAGGRALAFRSPAEAVIFSNARLRPLTAIVWLQMRRLAAMPLRFIGVTYYILALTAPRDTGPLAFLRPLFVVAMFGSLLGAISLPSFLLARRGWRLCLQIVGWTLCIVGVTYALAAIAGPAELRALDSFLDIDFTTAVVLLIDGDPTSLLGLALVIAGIAASIVVLGADAYPDLYEATRDLPAVRGVRGTPALFDGPRAGARTRIPPGALAFVWKDWLTFRRGRGALRLWLSLCALATGAGIASGFATTFWHDTTASIAVVGGAIVISLVIGPINAATGLAADVSKPIFWLGTTSLFARIGMWTAARAWRGGVPLGLVIACAAFSNGEAVVGALALPVALGAYWSLQAFGIGIFTILPEPMDVRGPILLMRFGLTLIYVAPPGCALGIASLYGFTGAGMVVAALLFLVQGLALMWLASYRLREFGATLATIVATT